VLFVSQLDTDESAVKICDMLVRSSAVDVVIIDSATALTSKAEIDMGLQARLML
jgi:recombination protein RecA